MKELYLEVFTDIDDDGTCFAPVETAVSLFAYLYCGQPAVLLTFVVTSSDSGPRPALRLRISNLLFEVIDETDLDGLPAMCKLPTLVTCEGTTAVAGLCAVLRQVIKVVDPVHPLLGFKQGCLYACAEASLWTKFCEVDIVNAVMDTLRDDDGGLSQGRVDIPEDVARFEMHMSQPVRIHNIQKQKQDLARSRGIERPSRLPDSRLDLLQDLEHSYAEGPDITLADVMLFPCFHVVFERLGGECLREHVPLTYKWYKMLSERNRIRQGLKLFASIEGLLEKGVHVNYNLPKVDNSSLYKGEMKKRQPNRHFYTRQEDIDECFKMLEEMDQRVAVDPVTFGRDVDFDWDKIPSEFRLDDSQVPLKRLERKDQQLQNLAKAVMKVARAGDRIVDFCSGSGHLGLILGHALPQCTVILLENKEQSLTRARDRAAYLKLANVIFCQSNVDYFRGRFDVGVCLHACGVATDLVMERCLQEGAAFVCCPCCYGSVQSNHVIAYPRSRVFRESRLTEREYFVLGHSSDQTHGSDNAKTAQGNRCMVAIDTDRCLRAREVGYEVSLSKLHPPTCTPKNNLLVGVPPGRRGDNKSAFEEQVKY